MFKVFKSEGFTPSKVTHSKSSVVTGTESGFSLSENIHKLLQDEEGPKEGAKKKVSKEKRKETNLLARLSANILATYQKCNPTFMQTLNPRKELTAPSEGVLNHGYDNADGDYILRVTDLIVTPELKQ